VVSHGPPIEAIDASRIAGTAFSRQLVPEQFASQARTDTDDDDGKING
jgi:hypothetical protein